MVNVRVLYITYLDVIYVFWGLGDGFRYSYFEGCLWLGGDVPELYASRKNY